MKNFDVSIITPIYKGEKYIANLINLAKENVNYFLSKKKNYKVEYVFVNDYPAEPIDESKYLNLSSEHLSIRFISNPKNLGIQKARINGINSSRGKYVLMLDQDDIISKNTIYSQLKKVKDADMIVSNGYEFRGKHYFPIHWNYFNMRKVKQIKPYLRSFDQIISPGQCLIKKESIPKLWLEEPLAHMGSDDYYLYILMIANGLKIRTNSAFTYKHINTSVNFSSDHKKLFRSSLNIYRILVKHNILEPKLLNLFKRNLMLNKDMTFGQSLLKLFFKYPDLYFWIFYDTCI